VTEDSPAQTPPPKIDTTVPHSARIWNYWLGGKDNYPVDREAGDKYREIYPQIVDTARAARYFLARAVRYLAGEAGIRQFLDVGTGLPTVDNTHEVAQRVVPECRIVYVDNDPLVLAHARALLTSSAEGACDYIDADMREPESILTAAARTLDLTRPVALLLIGVMGHISDYDEASRIIRGLLGGLPAGSYLALADSISSGRAHREAGERYAQTGAVPYQLRTPEQVRGFFTGLTLVDPGVVPIPDWRPDPSPFPPPQVNTLGGVGRKDLPAGAGGRGEDTDRHVGRDVDDAADVVAVLDGRGDQLLEAAKQHDRLLRGRRGHSRAGQFGALGEGADQVGEGRHHPAQERAGGVAQRRDDADPAQPHARVVLHPADPRLDGLAHLRLPGRAGIHGGGDARHGLIVFFLQERDEAILLAGEVLVEGTP
jgi:hypothetical protein